MAQKKDKQQILSEILNFQVTTSILDYVTDIVWVKDLQGRYVTVSDSFSKLFDVITDNIISKTDYEFRPSELADLYVQKDQLVIKNNKMMIFQESLLMPNGEIKYLEVRKSPIYSIQGEIIGVVAVGRDITEHMRAQEYLHYLSYHDTLTKLNNRNFFEEIPQRLLKDNIQTIGILICDIDNLKLVNDTMGHVAGDNRLKYAAAILKDSVGTQSILARIGGDEFAAVICHATTETLDAVVQQIRQRLAQQDYDNETLPLNISIGAATGNISESPFFDILQAADVAMYRDKMLHSQSTRSSLIKTIMNMLTLKDYITEGHADRLQISAALMGQALGLPENRLNDLRLLARFHDIGKIGIPGNILNKPGPLTPEELTTMRRHPEIGFHLSQSITELAPIADWVLKHHEWWDGTGYPLGLKGRSIPLEVRIVHIADAYDAMTNDRPYRKALSHNEAIAQLKKFAGIQFDPELTEKFSELTHLISDNHLCNLLDTACKTETA